MEWGSASGMSEQRDRGVVEHLTGEEKSREDLERLAAELRRPHRDAGERRRRREAAEEAERNPRRGVRRRVAKSPRQAP